MILLNNVKDNIIYFLAIAFNVHLVHHLTFLKVVLHVKSLARNAKKVILIFVFFAQITIKHQKMEHAALKAVPLVKSKINHNVLLAQYKSSKKKNNILIRECYRFFKWKSKRRMHYFSLKM